MAHQKTVRRAPSIEPLTPDATFRLLAREAAILSETRVFWDGREKEYEPPAGAARAEFPPVVKEIAGRLYESFYTHGDAGVAAVRALGDRNLRRSHEERLHAANATRAPWSPGWRLVSEAKETLVLKHELSGEERRVSSEDFEETTRGAGRLRLPKGSSAMQPGWYHVRCDAEETFQRALHFTRLYWNVCVQGAVPLVASATDFLNRKGVPFHLKLLVDPQRYARADAAVLYLPRDEWARAIPAIERIHADVAPYLKAPVPFFTKPIARGVAIADDPSVPGFDESFGSHRCRLVAEGFWRARSAGAPGVDERVAAARARFEEAGLDPDRPYLHSANAPDYHVELPRFALPFVPAR